MITVLGLGFVGLTTALGFSRKGFKVYGIDIDRARVARLKKGEVPFYEPGLEEALREELGHRFVLDASLDEAVRNSSVIIICVGTPSNPDGSANLSYLLDAVKDVFTASDQTFKVIVTKSTVPPSTVATRVKPYVEELCRSHQKPMGLASNPEFLREGHAWDDFMYPDRIVIGVEDEQSKALLDTIYRPFNAPVHYVSYSSAEFIKYLSNTLLSTLISFSNEMAMIATRLGDIDVPAAFRILHEDKRWFGSPAAMTTYVYPGCGYGGYCLPKDTAAIASLARELGHAPVILEGNIQVNEATKDFVVDQITAVESPDSTIGILGLAFKSGSDDVRATPSKAIAEKLLARGYSKIIAYDPLANDAFAREYDLPIEYAESLAEIIDRADALVLLTSWSEFRENEALLRTRRLFDFRYVFPSRATARDAELASG